MPNTKSAERRTRNSARKQSTNHSRKTSLKTLERKFLELVQSGKKDEAAGQLKTLSSALDKAAKTRVIHRRNADRKKSRLATALNRAVVSAK
jgi:small subunit ribosomal protein S20